MTTRTTQTATEAATTALSTRNKIGLGLCVFLCLGDVASLATLPGSDHSGSATNGPPAGVLLIDAALGVIGLIAAFLVWRSRNRPAARVLAGTRIIAALSALPAFFATGVPAALIVVAAAGITIALVGVWLLLARPSS